MSQKLLVTAMHPKETATAPAPGRATSWPRDGPDRRYNNSSGIYGSVSKPWHLVNPKIAGKWMFIPLKMVLIGIDP